MMQGEWCYTEIAMFLESFLASITFSMEAISWEYERRKPLCRWYRHFSGYETSSECMWESGLMDLAPTLYYYHLSPLLIFEKVVQFFMATIFFFYCARGWDVKGHNKLRRVMWSRYEISTDNAENWGLCTGKKEGGGKEDECSVTSWSTPPS